MTVKIQFVQNEIGSKDVIVHGQFNLGRLYEQDKDSKGYVARIGIPTVREVLREVLRQDVPSEKVGDWDSTLTEYVNSCVLERIGVHLHPPVMENGAIEGFEGGYDVVEVITEQSPVIRQIDHALNVVRQGVFEIESMATVLEMAKYTLLGGFTNLKNSIDNTEKPVV